jgi:hypothetical protein
MPIVQQLETDRTSDLQFAAFLISEGHVLDHIDGEHGRRVFVFAQPFDPKLHQIFHISAAKRLLDAHRFLKTQLTLV